MRAKTIIHLLSGGLDSVTMLYDLVGQKQKVHCLLFDYKQAHSRELIMARRHCERLNVPYSLITLPELGGLNDESWVVPNRNAILLSVAVNYAVDAKADAVTIGCNADDAAAFPDCRQTFLDAINKAVRAAGYKVEIRAPYLHKTKAAIFSMSRRFKVKRNTIWTCYRGGSKPCGKCPACERLSAAAK